MAAQQEYKLALQQFQSQRLRRDHADLAAQQQYQLIAEFFFEEMYGPRDFTARDQQARRLQQFIHLVPGLAFRDVQPALELLELTNALDNAVLAWLLALEAPLDFDEDLYERAYRLADNYDQRVRQLDLVRTSLANVHRLARKPLIGAALRRTQGLAHTVGMVAIHRFLLLGYEAIQPVRDFEGFIATIYSRERARLDRIYSDVVA